MKTAFCLMSVLLSFGVQTSFADEGLIDALSAAAEMAEPTEALDWRVGDQMDFNVSAGFLGSGTMSKTVISEEGEGFWVRQQLKVSSHDETIDKLYRKSDGAVLKVVRNGSEQNPEDSKVQVISEEDTQITVPAGTFRVHHVVGKTKKTKRIELWTNVPDTAIDGTVKLYMEASFYKITSELARVHRVR